MRAPYAVYVGYDNGTMMTDSLDFESITMADPRDTLIGSTEFTLNGQDHRISMYTSDLVAPMDGGFVYFELKHLGVIYYRSTTWDSYRRLKTDDDSLNYIIDTAIDNIVLNPTLGCYEPGQFIKRDIKFKQPEVEN